MERRFGPPLGKLRALEEVCGSCTMRINGMVRQSCTALIESVGELDADTYYVTLEPMSKFPVMRDLIVDRGGMLRISKRSRHGSRLTAPMILDRRNPKMTVYGSCATRFRVA